MRSGLIIIAAFLMACQPSPSERLYAALRLLAEGEPEQAANEAQIAAAAGIDVGPYYRAAAEIDWNGISDSELELARVENYLSKHGEYSAEAALKKKAELQAIAAQKARAKEQARADSPKAGYAGIRWNSPCQAAIKALADKGVKFTTSSNSCSPNAIHVVYANARGAESWCSACNADRFIPGGHNELYSTHHGESTVGLHLDVYCRNGAFVAVRASAYPGSAADTVAALVDAAGPPVSDVTRACNFVGTCFAYSRHGSDGDTARYLQRPVGDARTNGYAVYYLQVADAERVQLETAQGKCLAELAKERNAFRDDVNSLLE